MHSFIHSFSQQGQVPCAQTWRGVGCCSPILWGRGRGAAGAQPVLSLTRAQNGRPEWFIVLDTGLVVGVSLLALHQEGARHGRRAPRTCQGRGERGEEDSLPLKSEPTVLG